MKLAIAADSFKGSLSAFEAACSIKEGVLRVVPDASCVLLPVADGGEGTLDAMLSCGGKPVTRKVRGPLGEPADARFAMMPDGLAVVEMAAASGLTLVPTAERDVMRANTYGTGELIRAALDEGASRMIIGIGGSATVDGGIGMLAALGARFLDADGTEILGGGGALADIAIIDITGLDTRLEGLEIIIACDVDNPLTGENGASFIFGPQKGASPEQVKLLDVGLAHLAMLIKDTLGVDIEHAAGAGAAGGLGGALMAFMGAKMKPGIDVVLDAISFDDVARGAALVITGEGRLDGQTLRGKVPIGVAARAARMGIPVIALAGSIAVEAGEVYSRGIASIESAVNAPMSVEYAMENAQHLLADAAERAMRFIMLGVKISGREVL